MSILELVHLLLAPFTFFSKAFLELIINGGNVKFGLGGLDLVWDGIFIKFRSNHKKIRVYVYYQPTFGDVGFHVNFPFHFHLM
jgi:hypothetical protein